MRRALLTLIHRYYLDALSRLPAAGHCYGPLHPVHNIIVNSVWYSAAFPIRSSDRIDTAFISNCTMRRLVQCSLDGLVASLRHLCPGLSDDDALWHLSLSRADLRAPVASARGAALSSFRLTALELEAAFQAADKAARHLKPAALALFASSVVLSVERDAVSLLNNKHELPHPPLEERFTAAFKLITRRRNFLIRWYKRWVELADAALCKYAQQTAAHYQLHVIYGIGSVHYEFNMDQSFHISFMAWPKDPNCAKEAPVFFFAEALPSGSDFCEEDITLCCTVQPSPSEVDRCHGCLTGNFQIDHPDESENFSGGQYHSCHVSGSRDGLPFPVSGYYGQYYTLDADGTVKDLDCPIKSDADFRCFDPVRDIGFVEYLDQELTSYISSWPSRRVRRFYRENIDQAILDYCSGIM
ncbi:hypothetical protein CFC21_037126 [Triticum aestivum]|uniref:Uncharacterized protein n=2 Tax=Triticum aestivum TaxID=4565 RepID=A0A3B6EP66_WHEAT|nr:hypothetical protein CFC21_037126 [Triticum aestivum]